MKSADRRTISLYLLFFHGAAYVFLIKTYRVVLIISRSKFTDSQAPALHSISRIKRSIWAAVKIEALAAYVSFKRALWQFCRKDDHQTGASARKIINEKFAPRGDLRFLKLLMINTCNHLGSISQRFSTGEHKRPRSYTIL